MGRLFGSVAKRTKPMMGVGASKLLRVIIKYLPKYILFFRNMKAVMIMRILRQLHWFGKVWKNFFYNKKHNDSNDDNHSKMHTTTCDYCQPKKRRISYHDSDPF